jgi:hypothetical protein
MGDSTRKSLRMTKTYSIVSASDANCRNITSNTFYLEHRMGVTFAREDPDDPIPVFKTREEWEQQKSTKINTAVLVTEYFLQRDDVSPVEFQGGGPLFPALPSTPHFTRDVKVMVYQEWPSYTPLVRRVSLVLFLTSSSVSHRTAIRCLASTASIPSPSTAIPRTSSAQRSCRSLTKTLPLEL